MSQAIKLIALDLDGVLVKYAGKTTLTETSFDTDSFNHVVSLARQHGISVSAQRDSYTHAGADFVADSVIEWNSQLQGYFNINAEFSDSAGLLANQGNYLVLSAFDTESTLRQFVKHLHSESKNRFSAVIVPNPTNEFSYCEISLYRVTNWHGLSHLAEYFNITADNVCAVGDQLNDLPMVQGASHGVAMGNAHDDLKAVANFICGKHDEDGLLDVVNYIRNHNSDHE